MVPNKWSRFKTNLNKTASRLAANMFFHPCIHSHLPFHYLVTAILIHYHTVRPKPFPVITSAPQTEIQFNNTNVRCL